MPVSSHETISQFNFLMPKNLEKHRHFCVSFAWNWSKIKIKNKGGFPLKPHFLHKTDHKISCLLLIMDANLSCLVNIIDAIHNWNSSNHIYWYFTLRYMYSSCSFLKTSLNDHTRTWILYTCKKIVGVGGNKFLINIIFSSVRDFLVKISSSTAVFHVRGGGRNNSYKKISKIAVNQGGRLSW